MMKTIYNFFMWFEKRNIDWEAWIDLALFMGMVVFVLAGVLYCGKDEKKQGGGND